MAINDPAKIKALQNWASASPEELAASQEAAGAGPSSVSQMSQDELGAEAFDAEQEVEDEAEAADGEFDLESIETYADEIAEQLSNGEGGDEELIALVEDYDSADGTPDWVMDEELWEGAQQVAADSVQEDDPVYWQVVAHLYTYMQGEIAEPEIDVTVASAGQPEPEEPEETPEEEV